jgi:hypothetical protein
VPIDTIKGMEPDRFDDVAFRILESPEPPPRHPRRRHRRWVLALLASVVTAGALAAGASALTDKAQAPTKPRLARSVEQSFGAHPCPFHRGGGSGSDAATLDDSARY